MVTAQQITRNMKVADTQGLPIGTVDQVQDDAVELTREGFADGLHHFVALAAVRRIDGDTLVVEPGQATTIEAVIGAVGYARRHPAMADRATIVFGNAEDGSGMGGWGAR